MKEKYNVLRVWLVIVLCLSVIVPYSAAFARDGGREHGDVRGDHRGDSHYRTHREVVVVNHNRYYYHQGRFYRPGWFGISFSLNAPPLGAIITSLPFGYSTVIVAGEPYYYYNHIYYRRHPRGYFVVPAPTSGTVVINVPQVRGGFIAVTLVKRGSGYVGPQGEYYEGNPTVEQLQALYGN
ncbi:MAG: DUF6515 family protein [Candidatus Omnitrophota bacterium]|jgi:hypothetical protein